MPSAASEPDPVPDRNGVGTDLGESCANLRAKGCPEGSSDIDGYQTCYEHLLEASEHVVVPTECLRKAASIEEIRRCGRDAGPGPFLWFRCRAIDGGT